MKHKLSPETPVLAVSPQVAGQMLQYGHTRIYELLDAGELISFKDGKSRRITVESIHAYVERKLAAAGGDAR